MRAFEIEWISTKRGDGTPHVWATTDSELLRGKVDALDGGTIDEPVRALVAHERARQRAVCVLDDLLQHALLRVAGRDERHGVRRVDQAQRERNAQRRRLWRVDDRRNQTRLFFQQRMIRKQ